MCAALRRAVTFVLAAEAVYLLVPWQAVFYGHFNLVDNQDLVIWMGAPIALLGARAAQADRLRGWRSLVFVLHGCLFLPVALLLNRDPHGFVPRNLTLFRFIGWVPAVNTVLALVARSRALPPS